MDAETRTLVQDVCRAVCRVEGLTPDEPIMEWESEAVSYRPSDPVWTRYATEEMCVALERIYAAGFEAAKEMAARLADTAHSDPQWDHGHQIISWYGAHVARHIRAFAPQEVASRPAPGPHGRGRGGMSDYARGYRAALDAAAKVADLFEEVNFSLCHDSIILDPVLANARQTSPRALMEEDFRESEKCQDHGTIHSSMAHAARNIAAAIRALPEESA